MVLDGTKYLMDQVSLMDILDWTKCPSSFYYSSPDRPRQRLLTSWGNFKSVGYFSQGCLHFNVVEYFKVMYFNLCSGNLNPQLKEFQASESRCENSATAWRGLEEILKSYPTA